MPRLKLFVEETFPLAPPQTLNLYRAIIQNHHTNLDATSLQDVSTHLCLPLSASSRMYGQ